MKVLRRALCSFALALLALVPSMSSSADLTIPNTFIQGSPAVANEVNQNFSATAAAVNSKQDRVTGACPPGQAVRSVNQNGTVVCETGLDARVTSLESLLNYMPVGPQTNVPQARVNLGGWTTCYTEPYNANTGSARHHSRHVQQGKSDGGMPSCWNRHLHSVGAGAARGRDICYSRFTRHRHRSHCKWHSLVFQHESIVGVCKSRRRSIQEFL
jgi:hypothetical protein